MAGDGRRGPRAADGQELGGADGAGLEDHEVGLGGGRAEPGEGHVDGVDVGLHEPLHQARALVVHVDHQHLDVAPAGQGLGGELGPAEHEHGGVVGQGVGELAVGAVALELVEGARGSRLEGRRR